MRADVIVGSLLFDHELSQIMKLIFYYFVFAFVVVCTIMMGACMVYKQILGNFEGAMLCSVSCALFLFSSMNMYDIIKKMKDDEKE